MPIGRTTFGGSGIPLTLSADGFPEWKLVGVSIDWSSVAAVGEDTTAPEGFVVKSGQKWLRYGQALCQITTAHAQTITVSGTPNGGSFTINVYNPQSGETGVVTLAFNSSVAATKAAFDAFFGAGNTVVSGAGALPGNVQTVTVAGVLRNVVLPLMTLASNDLTGGSAPKAAFAVSAGGKGGYYGPFDPDATDGRQTLTIGEVALLNESIVEAGLSGLGVAPFIDTTRVGAVVGGRVWASRLLTGTADSLVGGPTLGSLQAVMPRLVVVEP